MSWAAELAVNLIIPCIILGLIGWVGVRKGWIRRIDSSAGRVRSSGGTLTRQRAMVLGLAAGLVVASIALPQDMSWLRLVAFVFMLLAIIFVSSNRSTPRLERLRSVEPSSRIVLGVFLTCVVALGIAWWSFAQTGWPWSWVIAGFVVMAFFAAIPTLSERAERLSDQQ